MGAGLTSTTATETVSAPSKPTFRLAESGRPRFGLNFDHFLFFEVVEVKVNVEMSQVCW
jgi:hypothetical protein